MRAAVSWFHIKDFRNQFPDVNAHADSLFSVDRGRSTCAGGTGAADLAGYFVSQFIGQKAAEKAAKILVLDRIRSSRDVQPVGDLFPAASSRAVKRALAVDGEQPPGDAVGRRDRSPPELLAAPARAAFRPELGIGPMAAYLALGCIMRSRCWKAATCRSATSPIAAASPMPAISAGCSASRPASRQPI